MPAILKPICHERGRDCILGDPVTRNHQETSTYIDPTREEFACFRKMQREGPVHVLNLVRFRETAAYDNGTVATGAEAYRHYAEESGPVFRRLGGRKVWAGRPELMLIGPSEER